MNQHILSHFEDCLAAVQAGESIEDCLARYPEEAHELAPLLSIAMALESLPQSGPSLATARRARYEFLAEAHQRRTARQDQRRPFWQRIVARFTLPAWLAPVRALASAALTLVLVLVVGSGVISASSGSLPGDPLYGFKLLGEDIRRALAFTPGNRFQLEESFGARRRAEVGRLLTIRRQVEVRFGGLLQERSDGVWLVQGIPVIIVEDTSPPTPPTAGTFVQVSGLTQADGTVRAQRIEIEQNAFIGHVQLIESHQWQISGQILTVDTNTWIQGRIEIGDCVKIHARRSETETQHALGIEKSELCPNNSNQEADPAHIPDRVAEPSATPTVTPTATPTAPPTATPSPTWSATPTSTPTPRVTIPPAPTETPKGGDPQEATPPAVQPAPPPTSAPEQPAPTENVEDDDEHDDGNGNDNEGGDDHDDGEDGGDEGDKGDGNDSTAGSLGATSPLR